MKGRFTISRLLIMVAVAAVDLLLVRGLMRSPTWNDAAIGSFVLSLDAAVLLVFITVRRISQREPGDPFSLPTAWLLVLVALLSPVILFSMMNAVLVLVLEITGIG